MSSERPNLPSPIDSGANGLYDETVLTSPDVIDGQRIHLHAERLHVVKHRVRDRLAVVTRRAVSVRRMIEVDVLHEELTIDYATGDGSVMLDEDTESIVVLLRAEDVEIVKHVRVVEEVRLTTRRVLEQKRLSGAVRHETLEVDTISP